MGPRTVSSFATAKSPPAREKLLPFLRYRRHLGCLTEVPDAQTLEAGEKRLPCGVEKQRCQGACERRDKRQRIGDRFIAFEEVLRTKCHGSWPDSQPDEIDHEQVDGRR